MPNSRAPTSSQRSIIHRDGDPSSKPRNGPLVIALGDPAGIGAEVTLKALGRERPSGGELILVGCRRWLEESYLHLIRQGCTGLVDPADLQIVDLPLSGRITPGRSGAAEGAASYAWLTRAAEIILSRGAGALITAPIAKASWHAAGHPHPGQTERLAELAGVPSASMLFTARSPSGHWRLNTLLATTHLPLAEVPRCLGPELVLRQLEVLLAFCRRFHPEPHLVVAGLNPHAGEQGALGREEQDWLIPTLELWRRTHPQVRLEGPVPPDTCWLGAAAAWRGHSRGPDGYLALYHDQGLIPVKLLAFDAAVNTTLGLPFLRTSPDHGTAFEIAGRGLARPDSMAAAIATASDLMASGSSSGLSRA